ncbi:hypothetical protein RN001_001549 [Aquatica leii]|uniref:isopentenyl-diphosphate Delta-isomerase n=1 Tax=Aquatica leii TaxID=1421715 RepID=A0AAN7PGD9_9COLE|nr:hypothetical protein RN001_001549 [Aquatica leii]
MLAFTIRNSLKHSCRQLSSSISNHNLKIDPLQEAALNEQCFLVDNNDKVVGTASKKDCHLVKPDGSLPLHRAFSVFLFNKSGDLLLQKRADEKVTYPGHYTNSCCSHPIADVVGENDENNAVGIKRAAQRRLNYELGIPIKYLSLEKFTYLTRIKYMDRGNGKWGEHELDYVLIFRDDIPISPNPNEISEISFVSNKEILSYLSNIGEPLTPWFSLMLKYRLKHWWDNLENINQFIDHNNILEFGADGTLQ